MLLTEKMSFSSSQWRSGFSALGWMTRRPSVPGGNLDPLSQSTQQNQGTDTALPVIKPSSLQGIKQGEQASWCSEAQKISRERVTGYVIRSCAVLIGWWWVSESGDSQLSGSSASGLYAAGGHRAGNCFHLGGTLCLQDDSRVWLEILLSALEKELKGLDFMAKLLCLSWVLSFVSSFSHL